MKSIENNKLIAEFMGGEYERRKDCFSDRYFEYYYFMGGQGNWRIEKATRCQYAPEMLMYHTDWDWLMPVYQKMIQSDSIDHYTPYFRTFGTITDDKQFMVRLTMFAIHYGETLIEATYKAIVEYIKWYNEQSKPQP